VVKAAFVQAAFATNNASVTTLAPPLTHAGPTGVDHGHDKLHIMDISSFAMTKFIATQAAEEQLVASAVDMVIVKLAPGVRVKVA